MHFFFKKISEKIANRWEIIVRLPDNAFYKGKNDFFFVILNRHQRGLRSEEERKPGICLLGQRRRKPGDFSIQSKRTLSLDQISSTNCGFQVWAPNLVILFWFFFLFLLGFL